MQSPSVCELDRRWPDALTYYPHGLDRVVSIQGNDGAKHRVELSVCKTKSELRCARCGKDTTWVMYHWPSAGGGPLICSETCAIEHWDFYWEFDDDDDH